MSKYQAVVVKTLFGVAFLLSVEAFKGPYYLFIESVILLVLSYIASNYWGE